ncbi:hypothetical protein BDZ89DRAFT_900440, partial [Hymenopellis radicata]
LLISISKDELNKWLAAYDEDPILSRTWREAAGSADRWIPSNRFFKDADGLLFFADADYQPRLCVPRSLRRALLVEAHESAMEHAHLG